MSRRANSIRLGAIAAAAALALAACGGGDGGSTGDTDGGGDQGSKFTSVPVTVLDGVIQNALVCLDVNENGACDAGEPQGSTNESGQVTLEVPTADVDKYPLVAVIGTDAIDADTGAVTTPYTLKAPKDRTAVISPLTTLVQTTVESTGNSTEDAAASVQALLPAGVTAFDNYAEPTDSWDDPRTVAAAAAFAVAEFQRQQLAALAPAEGTPDLTGTTISADDLQRAARISALQNLDQIIGNATQDAYQEDTLSAARSQIQDSTPNLVASVGDTVASVATTLALTRSDTGVLPNAPGEANATLDQLRYQDANNWFYYALTQNADQAVADSAGNTRFDFRRSRRVNGSSIETWKQNNAGPERDGDLHWNGTAWADCSAGGTIGPRTWVNGLQTFAFSSCDGQTIGLGQRQYVDVSGRPINDILTQIRSNAEQSSFVASVPGNPVFSAGSVLQLNLDTFSHRAPTYIPSADPVYVYPPDVAAGGDADSNPDLPCNASNPSPGPVTSLDDLIAANRGTPCQFAAVPKVVNGVSLDPGAVNEWWSNSTLSWATVGNAPLNPTSPTSYYTGNILYRIAFGEGNAVYFKQCQQRYDGSARNCQQVDRGSYRIETLGDARVLSFAGVPSHWSSGLTWDRVYVERDDQVYYGYQSRLGTRVTQRLNLPAMNALFTELGIPTLAP